MKISLDIYQLITLIAGFIGIIFVQYIGVRENRITRYCDIITKQTLANNMFIRENSQVFTLMTRPDIIDEYRKKEGSFEYKKVLLRAVINMEHHFYHGLSQDRELINIIREIASHALAFFDTPTPEEKTILISLGNEYYNLMTLYDYSDWLYIKTQAEKKSYGVKYKKFDEIYKKEKEEIEKVEQLKRWGDF